MLRSGAKRIATSSRTHVRATHHENATIPMPQDVHCEMREDRPVGADALDDANRFTAGYDPPALGSEVTFGERLYVRNVCHGQRDVGSRPLSTNGNRYLAGATAILMAGLVFATYHLND
jgi:hypothetical protein